MTLYLLSLKNWKWNLAKGRRHFVVLIKEEFFIALIIPFQQITEVIFFFLNLLFSWIF